MNTKKICEQKWHKEVRLRAFQSCPICNSRAYHIAINSGGFALDTPDSKEI